MDFPRALKPLTATLIVSLALAAQAGDPASTPAQTAIPDATEASSGQRTGLVPAIVQSALDGTLKETATQAVMDALSDAKEDGAKKDGAKERMVVLRISKDFIRQHAPPAIEHISLIDRCLFGSRVTGTASTRGQPAITIATDHGPAVFTLHFKGTTTSKTVAAKHPIKAFNTGVGDFEVHRQIWFDGMQFREGPASIEATYSSKLDCLATPPGLRGRIVRRFAIPQLEAMHPKADQIAMTDMKATILKAFGKHSDDLVRDLNARLPWKQTVALLFPQQSSSVGHFASTEDSILGILGADDADIQSLPEEDRTVRAPIELWVHGTPGEVPAAKLVVIWSAVHFGLNQFRKSASQDAVTVEDIKPTMVGDWWVIRVGADLAEGLIDQMRGDGAGT